MPEQNDPDRPGPAFDAVILAGGAASRLGGADKPALRIGGRSLLDAALDACAGARRTVVVGPDRPVGREVLWTREQPPGAGPAAALAAGMAAVIRAEPTMEPAGGTIAENTEGLSTCASPLTIVLAADLPFIDAEVIHRLWKTVAQSAPSDAAERVDRDAAADDVVHGAVAVDESGRAQWLTACYRSSALLGRISVFPPDRLIGLSLRRLLSGLRLTEVPVSARAAFDCDTWEQVEAARGMGRHAHLE
jgi:molybdopterin-guanine dinucleotide biosynthesis protein A